ncbi:inorganic phosphate transporter [Notoacmeibacter ruber]|uniref:Phosphate transporter n=1 Tax=Notoacmeibacter ruber TaxID=2670375 RepID=A0A3L7JEP5_9HYPH|nr:inorganic phosphate transporter [Notoacmeibacter ruber]RLQ88041.1 anion permease [Notoacmeibacter ruber]
MADTFRKDTLDKDLSRVGEIEAATSAVNRPLVGVGIAFLFMVLVITLVSIGLSGSPAMITIVAAAAIGAYMAMNIGANDVANNVGPAVGAKAMTLGGALVIAAVCETAGALIAGGDVVDTISKGIVNPGDLADTHVFIAAMMAALIAAGLWVNLATAINAPASTTHSIVGGVMGGGIAAAGFSTVDWSVMGAIAASWVISPVLGGLIAAFFLYLVKALIVYREDKIAAARRWVPIFVAIMFGAFAAYLTMKGLKKIVTVDGAMIWMIGATTFALSWAIFHPLIRSQSEGMENRNQSLRKLFRIPLIISAALLSFAHGANDVANAVGPLAAVVNATTADSVAAEVGIPLWVMLIGAAGISLGLLLFGPKLIRLVGSQITKLNPMRAFCVALSAAITVIIASWFGLPVSSTHIAVGAVFGVGFFREMWTSRSRRRRRYIAARREASGGTSINMKTSAQDRTVPPPSPEVVRQRRLVRRAHVTTIGAAWVVTVPATAVMSAIIFHILRAFV